MIIDGISSGRVIVRNVVRWSAPSVCAASGSAWSIVSIAREIVTSGSVEKKIACAMITFSIFPTWPVESQNTCIPSALMIGGSMKGRMPSV